MRNLYENLLELDRENNIFYNIENDIYSFDNIININMKYLKRYSFNEDYEIIIRDENIIIRLIEEIEEDDFNMIELFRLNYIQFDSDSEDKYISNIIYSFLLNRFNYMKEYYEKMMKD